MTSVTDPPGLDEAGAAGASDGGVTDADRLLACRLGAALGRLMRVVARLKAEAPAGVERVDTTTVPIMMALSEAGPMRLTALADAVLSDPSTVSRQVATLVDRGHVERRPDPDDRRAALLAVSDLGTEALTTHRRRRAEHLARVMSSWPREDRRQIAALVDRLAADLADHLHAAPEGGRPGPLEEST